MSWNYVIHTLFWLVCFELTTSTGSILYVSNGTAILKVDTRQKNNEVIINQPLGRIIGLATDIDDGLLFWSDVSLHQRGIYKAYLNGSNTELIVSDVFECNGLSVDWVSNHLYWTDAKRRTINIANYDSTGYKIIISLTSDHEPRGIIVDPILGYIFWADQGTGQIERARLNGEDRKVLVDSGIHWPNQLAISRVFRKLYWVEASPSSGIMSCGIDGENYKKEREIFHITDGNPSFGLAVIGNMAIISTWFSNTLYSTFVETPYAIWRTEVKNLGSKELFSIVSTEKSLQPQKRHPCAAEERGGCSHLCLPSGWGEHYSCSCLSFQGLALGSDNKTCQEPTDKLFYTFQEVGEVGFISADGQSIPNRNIVGRSNSPQTVVYDPVDKVVLWSDSSHTVYKSVLGSSDTEVFLTESDGVGNVTAMDYDGTSELLYFSNKGQTDLFKGGTYSTWHTIEVINLNKTFRSTLVSLDQGPTVLALDKQNRYFYVTECGESMALHRANLDGLSRETLHIYKSCPTALSVREGRVYVAVADSEGESQILMFPSKVPDDVKILVTEMQPVSSLSVISSLLYYTIEPSNEELGQVKVFDLRSVESKTWLPWKPSSIFSLSMPKYSGSNTCDGSVCSNQCFQAPEQWTGKKYTCRCPDQSGLMLAQDGHTCTRPENFLLFADLNNIKMLNLDHGTEDTVHTLYHGNIHDNIVSIAYCSVTDKLYWNDQSKIVSLNMTSMRKTIIYETDQFLEGLTIDENRQRLYWTSWNKSLTGAVWRMKLKHAGKPAVPIIQTEAVPRALILSPDNKHIYWTENNPDGGDGTGKIHRAKVSGSHHKVITTSVTLYWPNALEIQGDKLYVADAHGIVYRMNLDGTEVEHMKFFTGAALHIFDMEFLGSTMLYTDWKSNSLKMISMVTGKQKSMATRLVRPMVLAIHHSLDLNTTDQCSPELNNCSHQCLPLPKTYECSCPAGMKLKSDNHTCIKAKALWEVKPSHYCDDQCQLPFESECMQMVSTFIIQCMCKPGHFRNDTHCHACSDNTYQPSYSNATKCLPCPNDMAADSPSGATSCSCRNKDDRQVGGTCVGKSTTTVSTPKGKEGVETSSVDSDTKTEPMQREPSYGNNEWPFFETSCPDGDILTLKVPPYRNRVKLKVKWAAFDGQGNKLKVKANYPIRKGEITLEWLANDETGMQRVIMEATDRRGRRTFCQFDVQVLDLEPPVFTYCPHDLTFRSQETEERVFWPNPEAEDNIKVASFKGTHQSGTIFPVGVTMVSYTAVDQTGNAAHCNFSVSVKQVEKACKLPEIPKAAFACDRKLGSLEESCFIVCQNNYVVNPAVALFSQKFSCNEESEIEHLKDTLTSQDSCLPIRVPSVVTQEFTMMFKGPCESDDLDLQSALSSTVVEYVAARNICPFTQCGYSNVSIDCDLKETDKNKRDTESVVLFAVRWNITIDNSTGFYHGQIEGILTNIRLELLKLLSTVQLNVDNREYEAVPKIKYSPLIWGCQVGELSTKGGCVACPKGTMYDGKTNECNMCSGGTYQPYDSQTECLPCGEDRISPEGATEEISCIAVSRLDDMSKFLIISACSFGFVFLVLTIIMFLQYKRQQKRSEHSTSRSGSQKYVTPNIHVAPPPIPRMQNFGKNSPIVQHRNSPKLSLKNSPKLPRKSSPVLQCKSDILRLPDGNCEEGTLTGRRFNIYKNHDYEDIGYQTNLSAKTDFSTRTNLSGRTTYQNDYPTNTPPASPGSPGSRSNLGSRSPLPSRSPFGSRSPLGSPVSERAIYTGDFRNFSPSLKSSSLRRQGERQLHLYDK